MNTVSRDTRQTILQAATELFRKQGYAATTVQQVADSVGISKGNLTYHFPNKQALCEEVHANAVAYVRDVVIVNSFAEAPDALSALENFAQQMLAWYLDDEGRFVGCLFTSVAIETQHTDEAVAATAREALVEMRAAIGRQLAAAQARGELRADMDAELLTRNFFWMFEGALVLARALNQPAEFAAFQSQLRAWLAP